MTLFSLYYSGTNLWNNALLLIRTTVIGKFLKEWSKMIDVLTWRRCPSRQLEAGAVLLPPCLVPTLIFCFLLTASVHSDGVILRDDFDSSVALDYTVWWVGKSTVFWGVLFGTIFGSNSFQDYVRFRLDTFAQLILYFNNPCSLQQSRKILIDWM